MAKTTYIYMMYRPARVPAVFVETLITTTPRMQTMMEPMVQKTGCLVYRATVTQNKAASQPMTPVGMFMSVNCFTEKLKP